jgi:hypothetical protein
MACQRRIGPPDRSARSGRLSAAVSGSLWHVKRSLREDGDDDEGLVMQRVILTPDLVRQVAGIRCLERASHAYLDMIADCTGAGYPLPCAIELAERAWDRVASEEQVVAAHASAHCWDGAHVKTTAGVTA